MRMMNQRAARKLENEIREYYGAKYVFTVSSGKAALFLILTGLKTVSKRRKVIIPAYTCYSVPSAIVKAGLDAIPCDMRPETLDYDFEKLQIAADDGNPLYHFNASVRNSFRRRKNPEDLR